MALRASAGLGSRTISPCSCMRRAWWKPALLPLQQSAQFLRGHAARRVLREHREDLVVGLGQPGVLQQVPVQTHGELVARVHEGPPGAVFAGVEPVRFAVMRPRYRWLIPQPMHYG